jgi:benzoyl-CoA reductase/2-hydroxyglutaryl-CoA dehydratase subunit BcrC/BadD/HgdB
VFGRIADIRREIERRRIHGVIHYVQAFCFRQMEDLILRKTLGVPVLTLEGDRPGPVDARTATRLESFLEMLASRQETL